MIESDATPEEVVNWFRSDACRDEVLLLWVSGEQGHSQVLQEIIRDAPAIDAVIQDVVAFLFISGSLDPVVVRGTRQLQRAPFYRRINRIESTFEQSSVVNTARSTMSRASDFATFFKLGKGEVPSLIILIKDLDDHIVCPIRPDFSLSHLRPWLEKIVAAARRHREHCAETPRSHFPMFPLQRISDANQTLEAKRRHMREALTTYIYSHKTAEEVLENLTRIVVKRSDFCPKQALKELDLAICIFGKQENRKLLSDGRLQKIREILVSINKLYKDIDEWLDSRVSVQAKYETYQNSLTELKVDIEKVRFGLSGSRLATLSNSTGRLLSATPRWLDSCSRFLEAINKLVETAKSAGLGTST